MSVLFSLCRFFAPYAGLLLMMLVMTSRLSAQPMCFVSTSGGGSPGAGAINAISASGVVTPFISGLTYPRGLALDQNGNLYVTTQDATDDIFKISPSGSVSTFTAMQTICAGLTIDSAGNVYVATSTNVSAGDGQIVKIAPDGTHQIYYSSNGFNPEGIAIDHDGNLFVANDYAGHSTVNVEEITTAGMTVDFPYQILGALGVAVDSNENVFASGVYQGPGKPEPFSAIIKIPSSGVFSIHATSFTPAGIAVDGNDNVFICNSSGSNLVKLNPAGNFSVIATGLDGPAYVLLVPEPISLTLLGTMSLLCTQRRLQR